MTTVNTRLAPILLRAGKKLLLIALLPSASWGAVIREKHPPEDTDDRIFSIVATNKPAAHIEPEHSIDPALADLALLDSLGDQELGVWTNVLPSNGDLFDISNRYRSLDTEEDVNNAIQGIKARDLVRDAKVLSKKGEITAAIDLLQSELEGFTVKSIIIRLNSEIGLHYYGLKDYENAAIYLDKAFKAERDNTSLACNLSAINLYLGRIDEAIEVLSDIHVEILEDKGLLYTTHFNLSCAYSLRNEVELSITHLELAARSDPPSTFANLGDTMLDNIRDEEKFTQIRDALKGYMHRGR